MRIIQESLIILNMVIYNYKVLSALIKYFLENEEELPMKKKLIGVLFALTLIAGFTFAVPAANQDNGGTVGTFELPPVF
jgi:hypothetical protein